MCKLSPAEKPQVIKAHRGFADHELRPASLSVRLKRKNVLVAFRSLKISTLSQSDERYNELFCSNVLRVLVH